MFTDTQGQTSPLQPPQYSYPLRSSTSLLFLQIFFTQLSLIIVILLIHFSLGSFNRVTNFSWSLDVLQLVVILIGQSGAAIFAMIAFLRWLSTIYLIQPEQIVIKRGIISIEEDIFSTEPIVEVKVKQSWLGRICNYGTLEITNPLVRNDFSLDCIPHPFFYASVIQDQELNLHNQNGHKMYIPFRDDRTDISRSPEVAKSSLSGTNSASLNII